MAFLDFLNEPVGGYQSQTPSQMGMISGDYNPMQAEQSIAGQSLGQVPATKMTWQQLLEMLGSGGSSASKIAGLIQGLQGSNTKQLPQQIQSFGGGNPYLASNAYDTGGGETSWNDVLSIVGAFL